MMISEYDKAVEAAKFLLEQNSGSFPDVAIICGTGLSMLVDSLNAGAVQIPYQAIPHFKKTTVQGHSGKIVVGTVGSIRRPVACLAGRLHTYEGLEIKETVFSVRVFAVLGVKTLIITNAAGGLNQSYQVGDIMVISDHLNLPGMTGLNPLTGPNDERFGPRFPPVNNSYPHRLRHKIFEIANGLKLGRTLHEGVYAYVSGPNYETAAECRALIALGADTVGMSTVPEVLTAAHTGIAVLGLSVVTNVAVVTAPRSGKLAPLSDSEVVEPSHADVLEKGGLAAQDVQRLVTDFLLSL